MPPVRVLFVLVGSVFFWALDGLNSYLTFFPGLPHLYEPSNVLRMISGTLTGLAISIILQPVFSFTLWRCPEHRRAVEGFRTLAGVLGAAAILILLASTEWAITLYPLAILSAVGVLTIFTAINAIIIVIALRRGNLAESWRDALPFFLWGGVLTLLEIGAIDLLRAWLMRLSPVPL